MIKKILALAATALFSMNASAGYIQYEFSGPVSGYFIQHDDDATIAYFNFNVLIANTPSPSPNGFRMNFQPQRSEGATQITSARTQFQNDGPTSFTIYSDFGGDQRTYLDMGFRRNAQGGFEYAAAYSAAILFSTQNGMAYLPFSGTDTGTLSVGTVNPLFAQWLDERGGYAEAVTPVIPTVFSTQVPEPTSIALLAIGAFGAAGVARRRRKTAA